MEPIYLAILVILAVLAMSDLMVGVANDAVNFLNSAIGSKAAPRKVIMIVASVGILVGVLTSSGMMEVARSGVFHPGMFTFSEIMMLFLAVMLTDVILLDIFNTLGLPTSTTVSLVFELLGAAVCVALFCIFNSPNAHIGDLSQYINSGKALAIISGILVSVVVAFVCGTLIMYITRVIFSFNYTSKVKSVGSLWCGIALTAIMYFAVFKGLKGTPLIPKDVIGFISDHIGMCVLGAWVFWSILMFILSTLQINTLKITVLAGTFSLALAFAGNDLVNFIGVFMAGFDSYNLASATGDMHMTMEALMQPVKVNLGILLLSGLIMIITLWFSSKARKVTETEVNLARQEAGTERFGSTLLSRTLVRASINMGKYLDHITPAPVSRFINNRFEPVAEMQAPDAPPFDLIRATVNLTVAALLISLATSLKLPLSTTYVSFMVAMGTSLADRAWGRESAVYRITGVLTVISGWFLTAFVAFGMTFIVASFLMWAGVYAVVILAVLCAYLMIKSNFKKKSVETEEEQVLSIVNHCAKEISESTLAITKVYNSTLEGVFNEDRKLLKQMLVQSRELYNQASDRKWEVITTLDMLKDNYVETGHYYVQVVDYLHEVTKSLLQISKLTYDHIDNNHEGLSSEQVADLKAINIKMNEIFEAVNTMLSTNNFNQIENVIALGDSLFENLADAIKHQIQRNKANMNTTRSSIVYLNILSEAKIIILQLRNLLKAQKHFIEHNQ